MQRNRCSDCWQRRSGLSRGCSHLYGRLPGGSRSLDAQTVLELLQSISGLELMEFPDAREEGLCCGGGGGRIWMDTPKGERFSDIRVEQAVEKGADIIAVACPYCVLNYRDSVLSMGKAETMQVKEVSELIAEAM